MDRSIFEEQQGVGKRGSAAQNKEERIFGGLRGMVALIPRRRAGTENGFQPPLRRHLLSLARSLREFPLVR